MPVFYLTQDLNISTLWTLRTQASHLNVSKIISFIFLNLVTPKVGAENELLLHRPATELQLCRHDIEHCDNMWNDILVCFTIIFFNLVLFSKNFKWQIEKAMMRHLAMSLLAIHKTWTYCAYATNMLQRN